MIAGAVHFAQPRESEESSSARIILLRFACLRGTSVMPNSKTTHARTTKDLPAVAEVILRKIRTPLRCRNYRNAQLNSSARAVTR